MFYVATNRRQWTPASFYSQGAGLVEEIISWANPPDRRRMLEIGCGAGRMLIHLSPHFERAEGADIAPEMIAAARAASLPDNVRLTITSGADLRPFEDGSIGFVFSYQVFQHIPDRGVIGDYLAEVCRILSPCGRAALQFDTRDEPAWRRLALRLPDPLLPRTRRRFIRRYPVPQEWLARELQVAGLIVADERGRDTHEHWVLVETRKLGRAPSIQVESAPYAEGPGSPGPRGGRS